MASQVHQTVQEMLVLISGPGGCLAESLDNQPIFYVTIAGYGDPRRGIHVSLVRRVYSRICRSRGMDFTNISVVLTQVDLVEEPRDRIEEHRKGREK